MKNGIILTAWAMLCLCTNNTLNAAKLFNSGLPFDQALAHAIQDDILLMAFVAQADCLASQQMQEATFQDPAVAKFIKEDFFPVKVDAADQNGQAWIDRFNINSFPAVLFFDKKGKIIKQVAAVIKAENFIQQLDAVVTYAAYGQWPSDLQTYQEKYPAHNAHMAPTHHADRSVTSRACLKTHTPRSPQTTATSPYRVFVETYPDGTNIEPILLQLNNQFDIAPAVGQETVDGRIYFKIFLGPVHSVEKAERIKQLLQQNGYSEARLIGTP